MELLRKFSIVSFVWSKSNLMASSLVQLLVVLTQRDALKLTVGFFVGNVGLENRSYDHMFAKFGSKTWSIQYEWTSQELNEHLRGSISCKDLCVGKLYLHSTHIFGPLELWSIILNQQFHVYLPWLWIECKASPLKHVSIGKGVLVATMIKYTCYIFSWNLFLSITFLPSLDLVVHNKTPLISIFVASFW